METRRNRRPISPLINRKLKSVDARYRLTQWLCFKDLRIMSTK
jgi:hypothetical protein